MSKNVAVIVTGDRHATKAGWEDVIRRRFASLFGAVVIHGNAPGIDGLAAEIADDLNLTILPMPAPWEQFDREGHGRNHAGPFRNKKMLTVLNALADVGYEVKILAFHNDLSRSKGTAHMVRIARTAGVPVELWNQQGERLA